MWRGSEDLPSHRRGIKVLGTPSGHLEFVRAQLEMLNAHHHTLLARIPIVEDVQSAWLLLVHCASARANYVARVVEPQMAATFCQRHDAWVWECLCRIFHIGDDFVGTVSMPFVLGGIGLLSACHGSTPAFWASWADTLPVIVGRHPRVARQFVAELEHEPQTRFFQASEMARRQPTGVMGFDPPSGEAAATGTRPPLRKPKHFEQGTVRSGW